MTITNEKHAVFGNCVKMSNGLAELWVTTDFGPRVIHAGLCDKKNMLYQDNEMTPLGEMLDVYNGDIHKLYGGHRLWIAPEVLPRCYHPDNNPVTCELIPNGMRFIAPIEGKNNIRKSFSITMSENKAKVTLEHKVENTGQWDVELALWCITMMQSGGKAVMPFTKRKTGLLPNRHISLWDYAETNDSRVYWGKDFITLTQNEAMANPFKLGYNNEDGWAAYFNDGQLFVKHFKPTVGAEYPDNGCMFETYTNKSMLELETLGPLVTIAPNGNATHIEEWTFHNEPEIPSNNESEITKLMAKYI